MKKKIAIISGSRAEWGLLQPLYHLLGTFPEVATSLIVTGSHLDENGDNSIAEIADECRPDVLVQLSSLQEENAVFNRMADLTSCLPVQLQRIKPDLAVILGDRYEIFMAATVCRLMGIRLAHISGGEITLGAFDDCLRHCLTKLSDLHFTATEDYRRRVIQLGENPERVFNVGEVGLYRLSEFPFTDRCQLAHELGLDFSRPLALFTFHPETCHPGLVSQFLPELLPAMLNVFPRHFLVFTSANADPEGETINSIIRNFTEKYPETSLFTGSLGRRRYLSLARHCDFVGGNSSSAIVEIPALKVPALNFGMRQKGRPHGSAVVDLDFDLDSLRAAAKKLADPQFRKALPEFHHPYAGEKSIDLIGEILYNFDFTSIQRSKPFYDLPPC